MLANDETQVIFDLPRFDAFTPRGGVLAEVVRDVIEAARAEDPMPRFQNYIGDIEDIHSP